MEAKKQNRQLSDICQTTDMRIHSKNGLFEMILKEQPPEVVQLRDDIVRLSYSIKSLGMQNGEIGILTKRMPLRLKQKPAQRQHQQEVPNRNYVTHGSFFSAPLHVVKKQKSVGKEQQPVGFTFNPEAPLREESVGLKKRKQVTSMKNIRPQPRSQSKDQYINTTSSHQSVLPPRITKSYSQLLTEVNSRRLMKLEPLNSESTFLERIKKISNLTKVQLSSGQHAGRIAYLKNL